MLEALLDGADFSFMPGLFVCLELSHLSVMVFFHAVLRCLQPRALLSIKLGLFVLELPLNLSFARFFTLDTAFLSGLNLMTDPLTEVVNFFLSILL